MEVPKAACLWIVWALLALAGALAAETGAPGLSFRPAEPTSRDRVTLTVSDTSSSPCALPQLAAHVEGRTVRLDLSFEGCGEPSEGVSTPRPAGPQPFTVATRVGPLPAGSYAVQLFSDGSIENAAVLQVGRTDAAAGLPGSPGLGGLAVVLLLALVGAALLR